MPHPTQLDRDAAVVLVIDLQERLLATIHERERVVRRAEFLIRATRILGVPVVWTEQYRKGLGPTDPAIVAALGDAAHPLEKLSFSCLGDDAVARAVEATGRRQLILCGIETHVCVMQTALDALAQGRAVFPAEDALGSRRPSDHEVGLRRMTQAGATPATSEMLVMEALGRAGGEAFKAILPLLKE